MQRRCDVKKIVPVLVVVLILVAMWFFWPRTPVTFGLSTNGITQASLTITARPTLPSLPYISIWGWVGIGTISIIALLVLDLRFFGIFEIFADPTQLVYITWQRAFALVGVIAGVGILWGFAISFSTAPVIERPQSGFVNVDTFNGQEITIPEYATVDAEADGPITLTNTRTGEVITAETAEPRIGWPSSNYFVIPRQSISAGMYIVNGVGKLGAISDTNYATVRFEGIASALASREKSGNSFVIAFLGAMWLAFSIIAEAELFLKKGTKEEWEAVRTRRYEESKRK